MPFSRLSNTQIGLNLGFIQISGTWEINDVQKKAAWEMYVELATRITVVKLEEDEGLIREAFNSLYSLFATTRGILKAHGPEIATPIGKGDTTFGHIAVNVLNLVIRPLLSKWHPVLLDYENIRPKHISQTDHERNWEYNKKVRSELNKVREELTEYANVLAEVAGVSKLV